jgi:ligand-binding sensor domain-containing protein
MVVGGEPDLSRPRGLATSAALQSPVVALSWMGDTLVALTRDQLLWRTPRGVWTLGPSLSSVLGRLRVMVPDEKGMWIAGERGVAFARLDTPPLRPLLAGDLAGDALDLALDADHLWVATTAGLMRWRLDAIRP